MKNCSLTGGETNGSNMQNKKTETKQNRLGRMNRAPCKTTKNHKSNKGINYLLTCTALLR